MDQWFSSFNFNIVENNFFFHSEFAWLTMFLEDVPAVMQKTRDTTSPNIFFLIVNDFEKPSKFLKKKIQDASFIVSVAGACAHQHTCFWSPLAVGTQSYRDPSTTQLDIPVATYQKY